MVMRTHGRTSEPRGLPWSIHKPPTLRENIPQTPGLSGANNVDWDEGATLPDSIRSRQRHFGVAPKSRRARVLATNGIGLNPWRFESSGGSARVIPTAHPLHYGFAEPFAIVPQREGALS